MSAHDRFDLDHWLKKFSLEWFAGRERTMREKRGETMPEDWLPGSDVISSPIHIASVEHTRRGLIERGVDLGPAVPTDVFLWRIAPISDGPVTRIGGRPFRDPRFPWPITPSGQALPFFAQISFLDSNDLVPTDLPGDVLSMYGLWSGTCYLDPDSIAFEWSTVSNGRTAEFMDIPSVPDWHFCAEGVIHRTVSYPNCDDSVHDLGIDVPNLLQATQIGANPFEIQGGEEDQRTIVATFSSLQAHKTWPFINCSEVPRFTYPKGHEGCLTDLFEMMIGDMGSVYIYRDSQRKYTQSWNCY